MSDLTVGKESYFQHEFFHWILTTGFDFKSEIWTSIASALYLWKQKRWSSAGASASPNIQGYILKCWCSEMHQAPIPKAVAFSLTPVRASPVAQPSEEQRGESMHLSAFQPGLLLSPVPAADINKYKMHGGFVKQVGWLAGLAQTTLSKDLGFVSNMEEQRLHGWDSNKLLFQFHSTYQRCCSMDVVYINLLTHQFNQACHSTLAII